MCPRVCVVVCVCVFVWLCGCVPVCRHVVVLCFGVLVGVDDCMCASFCVSFPHVCVSVIFVCLGARVIVCYCACVYMCMCTSVCGRAFCVFVRFLCVCVCLCV